MGTILRQLLNGEEKYDEMAEQVAKMEAEENGANKPSLPESGDDGVDPNGQALGTEGKETADTLHAETPAVPEGLGAAAFPSDIKPQQFAD